MDDLQVVQLLAVTGWAVLFFTVQVVACSGEAADSVSEQ